MHRSGRIQSIQRSAVARHARQADSWGFFNVLTAPALLETVEQRLPAHRERLFPPTETLSMFLAQVLNDDRSCQAAVNESARNGLAGRRPSAVVPETGFGPQYKEPPIAEVGIPYPEIAWAHDRRDSDLLPAAIPRLEPPDQRIAACESAGPEIARGYQGAHTEAADRDDTRVTGPCRYVLGERVERDPVCPGRGRPAAVWTRPYVEYERDGAGVHLPPQLRDRDPEAHGARIVVNRCTVGRVCRSVDRRGFRGARVGPVARGCHDVGHGEPRQHTAGMLPHGCGQQFRTRLRRGRRRQAWGRIR